MIPGRLEQLLELLKEDASDPFLSFALAKEYQKIGQQEKALEIYLELIKKRPDYTGVYYHLGELYEQLGRTADAVAIYRHGLQVTAARGDQHAHNELKRALVNLCGDEEE